MIVIQIMKVNKDNSSNTSNNNNGATILLLTTTTATTTTTTTTTSRPPPPRAYTLLKMEYKFPEEAASNSSNVNVAIAART